MNKPNSNSKANLKKLLVLAKEQGRREKMDQVIKAIRGWRVALGEELTCGDVLNLRCLSVEKYARKNRLH